MKGQIVWEQFRPIESNDWKWSFKDYPKEKNGIKVFSCFACGGGSTMGYKLAGCDVLGDVEIDKDMNEIYVRNHHPKYNYLMDIREFNKLDDIPKELYDLDILDGSPPCTTFSVAGDREETWGKLKKFREGQTEQTLDDLSFVFIETVRKLKPKCMIMENVEGLLLGEAWSYVQKIYKDLDEAGYDVNHYVCKSEEMGVPQTRHRVFFIAFRKDLEFDYGKLDMYFNYEPVPYGVIKSGVGAPIRQDTQYFDVLSRATEEDKRISDVFVRERERERCFGAKIAWEHNVLQTITANLDYFRGKEKTRISSEDIIAAQTFPQDYDFGNHSYNNIAYVCGMSVPPVMIKRIVERIIKTGVFEKRGHWITPAHGWDYCSECYIQSEERTDVCKNCGTRMEP